MGPFGQRQSENWQKKTVETVALERPISLGTPNPNVPWAQLRAHTEIYLRKKGSLTPVERDTRLRALIERHGAKDIALAACAHAMSPDAIRSLFTGEHNIFNSVAYSLSSYLQAIIVVHHVNVEAIAASDARIAQALIPYTPHDLTPSGQSLKLLIDLFISDVTIGSLLYPRLHTQLCKSCTEFAEKLRDLREESQWLTAHTEVEWLPAFMEAPVEPPPAYLEVVKILEDAFADWRSWVEWKPDMQRLRLQESLRPMQRSLAKDLLALEGPDFDCTRQATLREGLITKHSYSPRPIIEHGLLQVRINTASSNGARDILERLSKSIEAFCKAGSDHADLLIHLCMGRPIGPEILKVLEGVTSMGNALVSVDVLQIYISGEGKRSSQWAAAMRLLPTLGQPCAQTLREALGPTLVNLVKALVAELQSAVLLELEGLEQEWKSTDMILLAVGQSLRRIPWLLPMLGRPLKKLLEGWPTTDDLSDLNDLRVAIWKLPVSSREIAASLLLKINSCYMEYLIEAGTIDSSSQKIIAALIGLRQKTDDANRRAIALLVCHGPMKKMSYLMPCCCLRQLPTLPDDLVEKLCNILQSHAEAPDVACINYVGLLADTPGMKHEIVATWRPVLLDMMKQRDTQLFEYGLTYLSATKWFILLADIQTIFSDMEIPDRSSLPSVLQPALQDWYEQIRPYRDTMSHLETIFGIGPITHCFLRGYQGKYKGSLFQLLQILNSELISWSNNGKFSPATQATTVLLKPDGSNSMEIYEALQRLSETSTYGMDSYLRVLNVNQLESPQVAGLLSNLWQTNSDLTMQDRWALEALSAVLEIHHDFDTDGDTSRALKATSDFVNSQVAAITDRAQYLSTLRRSLKAIDPIGTAQLLADLGVNDTSPFDDELANLPARLVNYVERISEDELELNFPLTNMTTLQRIAMGSFSCQSLIVRINLEDDSQPKFCVHLDSELHTGFIHDPLWCGLRDDWCVLFSHGQSPGRAIYHLSHIVSRHLKIGPKTIVETYDFLKQTIDELSQRCIICGSSHGTHRYRSSICENFDCKKKFNENDCCLLPDFQQDVPVADLLLTALQAATDSGIMASLLPTCPISSNAEISRLLGSLPPAISSLTENDLQGVGHHGYSSMSTSPMKSLFSWLCDAYGGFLVSAAGPLKIPSMSGSHQFLLANASPSRERAFARQKGRQPTRVVFHGTSLNRLYAILCQGLKVCSGGPLQSHGAAYGKGIYVAEDPSTALAYSAAYSSLGSGWRSSTFSNVQVLLGCEASHNIPNRMSAVHVIPNPDMLLLRYIFIMPPGSSAPPAHHIVPTMMGIFASLRSGSL